MINSADILNGRILVVDDKQANVLLLEGVAGLFQGTIDRLLILTMFQRLGADPVIASSIFLTTATDVASMGMLLGLAALLVT